ncbi:MAG TPA: LptA/OstA family protein [Myxococcales bacterium]|jgi:lipopolysaccharide export system protein LptA
MIGFGLQFTLLVAAAALPAGPLDFKARNMRIEPQERRVVLQGDVQLSRGDLNVTGQHAVAEYGRDQPATAQKPRGRGQSTHPEAGLGGQTVQRFTVRGNVHVQRGSRTANGEEGVVDVPGQTLVLTGTPDAPPVVRDGSEVLSGERILLRLDSEDVDVIRPRLVLKRSLAEDGQAKPTPVRVEADHLVLLQARRLARFTDDVVVRRGDAVVRSPRMEARYDPDGQLTRLELRGGVDVRQGERRATGETADYDAQARTLVLLGDPKLYDQGDVLSGDRIDLGLDSKEVRVERARGRLRPEAHKGERGAP